VTGSEIIILGTLATGVGVLVGCVGVGGVLLVPILTYLFDIPVHNAIAAAMFAYIFSGGVGTIIYTRHGSIQWKKALFIIVGAGPAAFVGAIAVSVTRGLWLEILIASLIASAGINALLKQKDTVQKTPASLRTSVLVSMGAVTGIGSAMTGTGGPLILVPIAVWLKLPALSAIGLSQAAQLPIALLATAGNIVYGTVDWTIGIILAVAIVFGAAIGARLAHVVPQEHLRLILAWVLVVVGLFIVGRLSLLPNN